MENKKFILVIADGSKEMEVALILLILIALEMVLLTAMSQRIVTFV